MAHAAATTAIAADGILDRERGGYRASHIALYSSFQGPSTARSTDSGYATGNSPETR